MPRSSENKQSSARLREAHPRLRLLDIRDPETVMHYKGLLVLVLSLGGAIGAAVQWTELNEAKVRVKLTIQSVKDYSLGQLGLRLRLCRRI